MYRFFRRNREKLLKYLLIFFLGIVSLGMVITLAPLPQGDTNTAPNVLASLSGVDGTTQDLRPRLDQQFKGSPLGNNPALLAQFAPNILDEIVLEDAVVVEAR